MAKKSITKNVTFNLIYQILTIVLPLVTTPYLSRVLGSDAIGVYGYTTSIASYFMLLGALGLQTYGHRQIARYQDDKKKYSKTFWEIFILKVIVSLIAILLFILMFCFTGEYTMYYRILVLYILSTVIDITWFFNGTEDFDKIVIRNLIVKALGIVCIFAFVKSADDLVTYFLIFTLTELLGCFSLWIQLPKYLVKVKFSELEFKPHIKPTLSLFLPQIACQVYTVLDKTMIGSITHDMSEVAFYEQAQKIAKAATLIVASIQAVMGSRISNYYGKNDKNGIKDCLAKSFKFVWLFAVPLCLGIIAVSSNLVPWFYGDGYDRVADILKVISIIIIPIGLSGITGSVYLVQTEKEKYLTISVICGAISNVIVNFILIPKLGGIGAAIASILAEVVVLIIQIRYILTDFSLKEILNPAIKCIISGFTMYFILYYAGLNLTSSPLNTLILVLLGMFTYFGMLFLLRYDFLYYMANKVLRIFKIRS